MKDLLKHRTQSNDSFHSDPVTEFVEDVDSDSGINGDVQRKSKRMKIANSDPDFEDSSQATSSQQASSKRKNAEVQRKGIASKAKDQQQLLLEKIRGRAEKVLVKLYRSTWLCSLITNVQLCFL